MCTSVFVFFLLFIGAVISSDENQAKIRFYRNSMENYTELPLDETCDIFMTSWYNCSQRTVIFAHGFTGHPNGPAVKAIITALIEQGDINVALLNWDKLAAMTLPGVLNSYMNSAIPNAIQLGADLAEALLKLSAAGLDLDNMHFVGHSLGAHVFGIAGNKIAEKGVQLKWITGLDPAAGFDTKPAHLRLNFASAVFTVAIHSDPHKYGSKREIGLVNFWPNYRGLGSVIQPGCPGGNSARFSDEDFCSHNRSWMLFIDAMQHPGTILGSHAINFRTWKKYSKEDRERNILDIGVFDINAKPGSYYFSTAAESPYGLGADGL